MVGPTTGELIGCLAVVVTVLVGVGILIGWFAPSAWDWVKNWLHEVTA